MARKICLLVHQNYFRDGRVRRYAETLTSAGYGVDVLCVRENDSREVKPGEGISIHTIPIKRNDAGGWHYIIEYGLAFVYYSILLTRLYLRNRYCIIHVHNMPDFLIFTAFVPKLMGTRLILDIHDPMPEFYLSKFGKSSTSPMIRLMKIQEKLSAGFADRVITANENFKTNLVGRGIPGDKITVLHNVPDLRIFNRSNGRKNTTKKAGHFSMIFPGTIAQRYGLDLAVRALPLIKGKIPDIRLVIIGQRTQYADELEALAEECGVSSHLSILPTLPVEEIPGQVLRADVGIYPAHRDAHMDIAIPSKVLEFAILGIPIVSSRLTVMQQLFSDSAVIYFDPGNIEQFADCILALYQYPSLGREMVRRAGHEFNSRYDFHKEQAAYIDLLKRMLAPSGLTLPASKESP